MINTDNIQIGELAGYSFDCSCGHRHSVDIQKIIIDEQVYNRLSEVITNYRNKKIFIVADTHTYRIYGEKVYNTLEEEGFQLASHIYEPKGHLIPDEKAIGRLITEIGNDIALIVAVGSGTINDISRFVSYKLKIPYIIVGTAPSMDGYASTVSPLIINGFKKTYEAVYPLAILADKEVLAAAPREMLCAGFGDILGKLTALSDWQLSRDKNQEYYCDNCVKMVRSAIRKCVDNAEGINNREPKAIGYLMEALILSGVVMGMVGNSRPASGSEHHLSHYWEMDAIAKNAEHPLHGNLVGVGTVIISKIYKMVASRYKINFPVPDPEEIQGLLEKAGCMDSPKQLGIDKEVFKNSVIHAKEIRLRYTVLHLAEELNVLEQAADELTREYYR